MIAHIEKEQGKQKKRYDRQGISEKLNIGDKVLVERTWLKNNFSSKLEDKWAGPYYVHNVLENGVYKLRTLEGHLVKNVVHGNRLKNIRKDNWNQLFWYNKIITDKIIFYLIKIMEPSLYRHSHPLVFEKNGEEYKELLWDLCPKRLRSF